MKNLQARSCITLCALCTDDNYRAVEVEVDHPPYYETDSCGARFFKTVCNEAIPAKLWVYEEGEGEDETLAKDHEKIPTRITRGLAALVMVVIKAAFDGTRLGSCSDVEIQRRYYTAFHAICKTNSSLFDTQYTHSPQVSDDDTL